MSTKDEYYQPVPEEFYIGFEFQFLTGGVEWKTFTLDSNRIERVFTNIKEFPSMFRVKYLDREDIESLGWVHDDTSGFDNRYKFFPPKSSQHIRRDYFEFNFDSISSIVSPNINTIFMGKIKNKSELKTLMSQLGIL